MEAKDFILDSNGDLLIKGGDFVVDFSDTQHVNDYLIAAPGTFKNEPLVGIDILSELNAPAGAADINRVRMKVTTQLEADGLEITELEFKSLEDFELSVIRK